MRTKIPEWSKSNLEVCDSGARSCIQYANKKDDELFIAFASVDVKVFNLCTYV